MLYILIYIFIIGNNFVRGITFAFLVLWSLKRVLFFFVDLLEAPAPTEFSDIFGIPVMRRDDAQSEFDNTG